MRTNSAAWTAAVIVGLEGVGLLALAAWQVIALGSQDVGSPGTGIALLILTVVGSAAVLGFAWAIAAGRSWGRSGGVVTQLLVLAVAFGAATGAYADPLLAGALAAPAVLALVLLLVASRSAGAGHGPAGQD